MAVVSKVFAIGGEERLSRQKRLSFRTGCCCGGVKRVHLLDGTITGVLLLELFKRDGMGTMVASDVYEGTRDAKVDDLAGIRHIIKPLEEAGILVRRTDEELLQALESFVVVEREGQIIACAALFPFFQDKCGEVAAIAVASDCRGQGQGDKLLDYIEKKASSLGLHTLFPTHNAYSRLVRETWVPRMFNRGDTRDQKAKNQPLKKIKVLHEEATT
ncbi:hypothetical protein Rs2_51475 [Raphanus sativus]|nr:hypothetical protein Rs2_51475 [Raphanus sativus]